MKYELEILEGAETKEQAGIIIKQDLRKYEVTVEKGIFKRGKLWKKGAKIELDKVTGDKFIKAKEVKELR